jgi:hypothetical protein
MSWRQETCLQHLGSAYRVKLHATKTWKSNPLAAWKVLEEQMLAAAPEMKLNHHPNGAKNFFVGLPEPTT